MTEIRVDPFQILKDAVLQIIHARRGRARAIGRTDLLGELKQSGIQFRDEREVREAVHQLRDEENPIVSSGGAGGGYWMAENWDEIDEFVTNELDARAMSLLEQKKKILRVAAREFGPRPVPNQLSLMQVDPAPGRSPQMEAMFGRSHG